MSDDNIKIAVEKYRSLKPAYEAFAVKLSGLLLDILNVAGVKIQIVESRSKEISSFEEKIRRPGKSYKNPLEDITDLCGCRVIVYYEDDVSRVSDELKKQFNIIEENLSRRPDLLDVDRFGYLSAHYIISIGDNRSRLIEWAPFASFFAEMQIRTVIQHAWSAVSHALQYKQEVGIPSKLQRRLYRIAGLFELADEEFVAIRKLREKTEHEIRHDIQSGEKEIPISSTSIKEFISSWNGKINLRKISKDAGFNFDPSDEDPSLITAIYELSKIGGINNLKSLEDVLNGTEKNFFK